MEKKLSIACSLVHNPEVLLLDEPTADLDPISRNETWNLINGINKLGTTMIVASHFLNELEVMCDRIAILYKGKIVAIGSPDDLRSQYFKDDEIILTSNPGKYDTIISELKKYSSLDISQLKKIAKGVSLHTSKSEKIILILLRILRKHNEKIVSLDVKKPSLGHIFESLRNK